MPSYRLKFSSGHIFMVRLDETNDWTAPWRARLFFEHVESPVPLPSLWPHDGPDVHGASEDGLLRLVQHTLSAALRSDVLEIVPC
jgi:hypothetical protein